MSGSPIPVRRAAGATSGSFNRRETTVENSLGRFRGGNGVRASASAKSSGQAERSPYGSIRSTVGAGAGGGSFSLLLDVAWRSMRLHKRGGDDAAHFGIAH